MSEQVGFYEVTRAVGLYTDSSRWNSLNRQNDVVTVLTRDSSVDFASSARLANITESDHTVHCTFFD
jgi:hypothetical protein